MEKHPQISVIVPVYNVEKYLRRCIDSILAQTFTDFELLLIDDGSKDSSGKICDEYAEKDKRIRVFHKENGGVSSARNVGLGNAKGEWIAFIDSDDEFISSSALALLECGTEDKVVLVLANSIIEKDGEKQLLLKINDTLVTDNLFFSISHCALWGYLFNARIINKYYIRFIDGLAFSEDRLFIYQYLRYCYWGAMLVFKQPIYFYRTNANSACNKKNGYIKAKHQFIAARYIKNLADKFIGIDRKVCAYLQKESNKVVNMGLWQFVESGSSFQNMISVCTLYKRYFGYSSRTSLMSFYYKLLIIIVKIQLKRLKSLVHK